MVCFALFVVFLWVRVCVNVSLDSRMRGEGVCCEWGLDTSDTVV